MGKSRRPNLRVVGIDLVRDLYVKPGDLGYVDINAPEPPPKIKTARQRLPRTDKPFTRVFHSWLANHRLFPPHIRLLMVLVLRSREGREPVRLTAEVAGEAGIPNRDKSRYARDLERFGAVRVEREGQRVLVLTVLLVMPK